MKPIKAVAGLPPRQTGNQNADAGLLRQWLQRALQIHDENAQEIAKRLKELEDTGGGSGEPGYTPVKGVDYWTPEDQAEMIAALNANFADYVVEVGVTNGWNWQKWNSGKYICWGAFSDTRTHYTTVNGFYGYYSSDFPYPITFPEPPIVHFNCKVGSGFAAPAGDVLRSSTMARCYALSTASGEVGCVWEMYVIGRWK